MPLTISHLPTAGEAAKLQYSLAVKVPSGATNVYKQCNLVPFLKTLKIAVDFRLTLVPVVKENAEFVGVISNNELLNHLAEFFNVNEPGGLIVLETEGKNYSFTEISRLVETNDAQIISDEW